MRLQALAALIAAATPTALTAAPIGRFDLAYPFPSPDGSSVVFQSNLDGRWQLYLLNLEDQAIRRLHLSERDDTHPAFSPDGKRIAFISNRTGNDEVHLLDIASGAVRNIAPHPGKDGHPKWSRDGQWLTFNRTFDPADKGGDGDSAIMRVRPDGRDLSVIADSPRVETFPSFSPDGRSVAFVEWFPNAAAERNRNGELVVVDIATKQRRQLTRSDGFDGYPFWGPSGSWIYFSTPVQNASGGREFAVHRIRPDGGGLTRLTDIDGRSEVRAIPSADERTLYYNIPVDGRTLIHSTPVAP
jgi:Tol biopolymer transport system component